MKEEALLSGLLEPTNEAYAIAKISAIKLCRYYNEQHKTNFMSVMPTNLYGINDNYSFEGSHLLPAFIRKFHLAKLLRHDDLPAIREDFHTRGVPAAYKGPAGDVVGALASVGITAESVTLWGSGAPCRELLFADDLAEACVLLMERYNAQEIGEFINLGTGEDMPVRDIAYLVRDVVGYEGGVRWDASRPDGTPRKLVDVTRAKAFGWKASTALKDGVHLAYKDYLR